MNPATVELIIGLVSVGQGLLLEIATIVARMRSVTPIELLNTVDRFEADVQRLRAKIAALSDETLPPLARPEPTTGTIP